MSFYYKDNVCGTGNLCPDLYMCGDHFRGEISNENGNHHKK